MRLVLDTNAVASALFWEGAPKRLLAVARGQGMALFTSPPLIEELADVYSRRKFEKQVDAAPLTRGQLLDSYVRSAVSVDPVPTPRIVADPDDDVVIGTGHSRQGQLDRDRRQRPACRRRMLWRTDRLCRRGASGREHRLN